MPLPKRIVSAFRRPGPVGYLLLLCMLLPLLDAIVFGLTNEDEGNYSAVAREMVRKGQYLVPHLQGQIWFNKPPLLYWLMTFFIRLFGPTELAVRLPSIIAFWATMLMVIVWTNRRFGKSIGTYAALIFALSPLTLLLSRLAITDMLLTCCLTGALIFIWEASYSALWCIPAGITTGLAVLAKGPVGLAFVGLQTLVSLPLLLKEGFKMRRAFLVLLIALLVPMPWYAAVYIRHGHQFFTTFIITENLLRFAGGDAAHAVKQPILYLTYYALILWALMSPFSARIPLAAFGNKSAVGAYLSRWCLVVFGFFTVSITKLPAYMFPLFPAMSVLIAATWVEAQHQPTASRLRGVMAILPASLWLVVGVAATVMLRNPLSLLLGIGQLTLAILLLKGESPNPHRVGASLSRHAVLAGICILTGFHFLLQSYDRTMLSPEHTLAMKVPKATRLVVYNTPETHPSLYFYTDGRAVFTRDERLARRMLADGAYCLTTTKSPLFRDYTILGSVHTDRARLLLIRQRNARFRDVAAGSTRPETGGTR